MVSSESCTTGNTSIFFNQIHEVINQYPSIFHSPGSFFPVYFLFYSFPRSTLNQWQPINSSVMSTRRDEKTDVLEFDGLEKYDCSKGKMNRFMQSSPPKKYCQLRAQPEAEVNFLLTRGHCTIKWNKIKKYNRSSYLSVTTCKMQSCSAFCILFIFICSSSKCILQNLFQ